jgi:hypothetical protein
MKKLFLSLCLLMAISYVHAAFVPTAGVEYYVTQIPSNTVIGASGSTSGSFAVLQTPINDISQPITFIPVDGKPGIYNLKNRKGNYLTKSTNNTWDIIFQSTLNGTYSEWSILGDVSTSIQLINNNLQTYLAPDTTTPGSGLYAKPTTNTNGIYSLVVAPVPAPALTLLQKVITIEIEKDVRTYPFYFNAIFFTDNIDITPSAGFTIDKSTFTPADFAAGTVKIEIGTTVAIGDTGKIVFSSTHAGVITKLDSVKVTPVATYARKFIQHVIDGLVIGNNSTDGTPSLTSNINDISQKFFLRPVHPALNDSMFYIVQDGYYKMLRKFIATTYNTEFGYAGNEAIWTLKTQTDGKLKISNFVTGHDLGTDGTTANSPVYDDKTWAAGGNHEWILVPESINTGVPTSLSNKLFATISAKTVQIHGTSLGDNVRVYNISGQMFKQITSNSDLTSFSMQSGIYIIKVNDSVLKIKL